MAAGISVNGAVATPLNVDAATLATGYTPVTVTIGTGTAAATYTGVSVYGLISQAGFEYPTASVKNGFLRDYITVTFRRRQAGGAVRG